jgi:hypothetical protein
MIRLGRLIFGELVGESIPPCGQPDPAIPFVGMRFCQPQALCGVISKLLSLRQPAIPLRELNL